jgi:hypothetical protein
MIEAIVISFIVGFAVLHVMFRLLPKPAQQKLRSAVVAGLNKIGLDLVAQPLVAIPQAGDKTCRRGCDECGMQAANDKLKVDRGAKVVQFYPRFR